MVEVDCDITERQCEELQAGLPESIRARAQRYLVARPRLNLVASQFALRTCLEGLGIDPRLLRVCPQGRPYLEGRPLEFNLSHSGSRAVILLGRGSHFLDALGVDIEHLDRKVEREALARRFFTSDECVFAASDPRNFFQIWTRKEAVLKTNGVGLRVPLNSFQVLSDQVAQKITGMELSLGTELRDDNYLISWAIKRSSGVLRPLWVRAHRAGWLERVRAGIEG